MFTVAAAKAVPPRGTMKAADVTAVAITIMIAALPVLIRMAMRFWFLSSPKTGKYRVGALGTRFGCRILDTPHPGNTRWNRRWHQDFISGSRTHRVAITDVSVAPRAMTKCLRIVRERSA